MNRPRLWFASVTVLSSIAAVMSLNGCGGSPAAQRTGPPPASYSLGASALSPATVTAGTTATSTITVTPVNGYTGSVSLSCSSITGATPEPTCSFSVSPAVISGTTAVTSVLTVTTTTGTPGGSYAITVAGSDANQVAPSNGSQALSLTTAAAIEHVVIIFQENRTPDNLFHGLCIPPYGSPSACNSVHPSATQYDLASSGVDSEGNTITLNPIDLGTIASNGNPDTYDLSHTHSAFVVMCNEDSSTGACQMNGADLIPYGCTTGVVNCPPPADPQFMYVFPDDVAPYLTLAQTYTFADHMFQTNQGPSFPAHQFILSGTSAPSAASPAFAAENPLGNTGNAGCIAVPTETVILIDPAGNEANPLYPPIYPCFEHATLTDLLDAADISWRYYAPSAGSIWTAPDAIQHMCVPDPPAPNGTACTGSDWTNNVVLANAQDSVPVLSDIVGGKLATVSWVIPNGLESDHALSNDGSGPSYVASIVNAIGNSPYWANTVIILTWDDWGGWYDHVPPQMIDNGSSWGSGYVYGFRVPMVVISPYAKPGYISDATHDFGSILKFVETTYGLPLISTVNGGYADAYADDLSDCFNFTQTPVPFQTVAAPLKAEYFRNDKRPPSDPDDD